MVQPLPSALVSNGRDELTAARGGSPRRQALDGDDVRAAVTVDNGAVALDDRVEALEGAMRVQEAMPRRRNEFPAVVAGEDEPFGS